MSTICRRCKTTGIFGRMQSIQNVVVAGIARMYLDVFAPMLFQLFNKCSPHHNMTFFCQTHGFGYRPKPTMFITNNIHNSLNVWSHEFWHVIHRTRWIIISWNRDRRRNRNRRNANASTFSFRFSGCWESIVSHEDEILRVVLIFLGAPLVGTFLGGRDNNVVSGNANNRKTSLISSFIWNGTLSRRS